MTSSWLIPSVKGGKAEAQASICSNVNLCRVDIPHLRNISSLPSRTYIRKTLPTTPFPFISSAPHVYTTRNKKRTNQCKQKSHRRRHRKKKKKSHPIPAKPSSMLGQSQLHICQRCTVLLKHSAPALCQYGERGGLLIEGKGKRSKPNRRAERRASQKCPFHRRPQSIGSTEEEDVRESEVSPLRGAPLPKGRQRGAKLAPG